MASGTRTNSAWQPSIVAEFPSADRLEAVLFVGPVLAQAATQAGAAVAARRDCAGDHPLPLAKAFDRGPDFLDNSNRLMANR
jgi:hypothetical protein